VNVTVAPYIAVNNNKAPVFAYTSGSTLGPVKLYVGDNYYTTEFKLPKISDANGDNTYVSLRQGRDKTITYYDNSTHSFKFYDFNMTSAMVGTYTVDITLGDDHWLGPMTTEYALEFIVEEPIKKYVIPYEEDTSSIGAKVADLGTSGKQAIDF